MPDESLRDGIVGLITVVSIGLLSLPASGIARTNNVKSAGYTPLDGGSSSSDGLYEDEDGTATADSVKAYSDFRPRIAAWLSVVAGLGAALAYKILDLVLLELGHGNGNRPVLSQVSAWSSLACWILICLQCVALPLKHRFLLKWRLTVYALVSSLLLAVSIALREGLSAVATLADPQAGSSQKALGALVLLQLGAALAASFAFASFRRRPDVYERGLLVDQQHTQSLLALFSYSWNRVVFDVARERQMNIEDIPVPAFETRSRNLLAHYLANCGEGPLWWRLIKVYSHELMIQWALTLVIAFLALFPQVVLYNFLARIESRRDYASTDPALFAWVLGLLLSQLLQVGVGNRLRWITNSRLDIPVGSLLQSLVFAKALRQYETPAPGQKEEKKGGGEDGESGKDGADGKKDAPDTVPDGRKKRTGKGEKKKGDETRQSVVNHMKLDSNRVCIFCQYNNNFPMALFKLALAGGFLVHLMGWKPVLAGLGSAALMVPLTTLLSRKYSAIHFGLMKYRDGKAHLLTEALQGMRQIRYSALEQHWEDKILASRNEELRQYWKVTIWQCLLIFLINMGPLLLASVAFSVYAWENGTHIKASIIFTSLGLFDQLDEAIALLPMLQMYMVEAWTSAVRLEKYFSQSDKAAVATAGETIAFEHATVSWPKLEDTEKTAGTEAASTEAPRDANSTLADVTLEFPPGELSVITGKTGSGKSLLLAAILGEVVLVSGVVRVPTPPPMDFSPAHIADDEWIIPQATSFVSQTPWIESGTVKENIIFGLPFYGERYAQVVRACALEKDLEFLVSGDETEVGPKGVTLSGGQRWRIALARALYSRAGIIVLDDVLGSVDAHVGRWLVDEALTGDLAKGRTRILATHHAELVLPRARYLVCLHDGKLQSAEQLPESGEMVLLGSLTSQTSDHEEEHSPAAANDGDTKKAKGEDTEEKREEGRVKWKVYHAYYKASGAALSWALVLLILVLGHFLSVARTWSLKELSQQASSGDAAVMVLPHPSLYVMSTGGASGFQAYPNMVRTVTTGPVAGGEKGVAFWMGAYVVLYLLISVTQVVRNVINFVIGMRAARLLFQRMTHAILRAPLRWLDTVPSGRILNRFTSDTFAIDRRLSGTCFGLLRSVFGMLIIIATSLSVSVWIIFFGLFLLYFYARIAGQYVNAAREVKRINSVSHSPIYDQFSSVLSGLSTIRAFGRTKFYMDRMFDLIDNSSKASWALQLNSRWMAFRMGMLGAVFVTAVAIAVALGHVNAALAGFSLTFALRYTGTLTTVLQNMTSAELCFNACERVLEYTEIETEPEGGKEAPAAWPAAGRIDVDRLTISYAEHLPPVLQDLSFSIGPGERVGIVGRTGAGKSTLALALFRLLEARDGCVRIDGIDISTLRLAQLRSRLSIIPQDPFLFSGTLRSNLDMEGVMEDSELHAALQRVHLVEQPTDDADGSPPAAATTSASPETPGAPGNDKSNNIFTNLSYRISTGGTNLSQGQRQLVCLARALLTRPKICILDEATSALDRGTDEAIQESLRKEFAAAGCTVLVIAHRLSTVADFDRLLVLDKGRLVENGTPRELLERGMARASARDESNMGDKSSLDEGEDEDEEKDGREEGEEQIHGDKLGDGKQERLTESELGSSTQGEGSLDVEADGTGAFWELVQKSAEKEKLMEIILGRNAE